MRFELKILFCLLSASSIGRVSADSGPSSPAAGDPQTTASDRPVVPVDGLASLKSADSAVGKISKLLECLVDRPAEGGETTRRRRGCHQVFSSVWTSARRALFDDDDDDNEIGESTKSKKKPWDVQTLMLGAGAKLILFLPVLAVLTGKAISLSLTSLLITSLGFLYRNQLDSFAKRSDSAM